MTQSFSNFNSQLLRIALLCVAIAFAMVTKAQQDTAIVRTYGGPFYEEGKEIIECATGGYAIIGTTGSDQLNNTNFYLLRLDEELNCIWNKNYGGAEVEWGQSIVEDSNGNLLICGYTNSFGEGGYDILVYKVNDQGDIIWQKTYGGSDWDFGYKIIAHPTEGYLICGKTYSYGNGGSDGYLIHISDDGNLLNDWTFGGEGDDELVDIIAKAEYVFIVGSQSVGALSNRLQTHYLVMDNYNTIIQDHLIDNDTEISEIGISCSLTSQNLLLVSKSYENETWNNYNVRCIDLSGTILWNVSGSYLNPSKIVSTPDDGYLLLGTTTSYGLGGNGAMIERRDENGYYLAAPTFGESLDEFGISLLIDSNQRTVFIGSSNSYNQNQSFDSYVVRIPSPNIAQEYLLDLNHSACFTTELATENVEDIAIIFSNNQLSLTGIKGSVHFTIYDIQGKIVHVAESENHSIIDLNFLSKGFYIIQFESFVHAPKKFIKL
jgi:hypothetical protein